MTIDIEKLAKALGLKSGYYALSSAGLRQLCEAYAAKVLEDKEREITELQDWKKQAIDVENEWDEQAVGKALNVQLGQSIRRSILPKIIELQAHINDLREVLEEIHSDSFVDSWQCKLAEQALSKTPAQSLQERDNEVIEMCAKVCDEAGQPHHDEIHTDAQWAAKVMVANIRALKGK